MAETRVRPALRNDLPAITEIYNYYVVNTPITFDLEPVRAEDRVHWFDEHSDGARYRLLVAEDGGRIVGYAGTGRFRDKAAYDTSVEVTIYCAHDRVGRGIGTLLYRTLFESLRNEDVHRLLAGITMPNDESVRLHERFGFTRMGVYSEVGRKFGRYWDVLWMERALRM